MDDALDERVDALERALTDGHAADGLPEAARTASRVDELEATVEELDDRLAELEAAVQALRGFAGGVDAVDEAVERRANAAIARVERLEAEVREGERGRPRNPDETPTRPGERDTDGRIAPGKRATRRGDSDPDPTRPDGDRPSPNPDSGTADGRHAGERAEAPSAANGARGGADDPGRATLAAAAADTARAELAAEGSTPEPDDGTSEATLAERIRRLL
ncbi:DUF7310 family coiled-coil domain-containing protein [Haloplanus halophilus]|uniref:DUF7310 family coiled-coil domain-containing protein n=1 Tax=Haloplanus halophilus TaxID=2949993 RepID=UPI00204070A9|nr:hypothetical protein [Haloplanus sp. GDY1]